MRSANPLSYVNSNGKCHQGDFALKLPLTVVINGITVFQQTVILNQVCLFADIHDMSVEMI